MKKKATTYKFNNSVYSSYQALASAFHRFPDEALITVNDKTFIKMFKKDKEMFKNVKNILNTFEKPEVRLGVVTYLLNPQDGILIDGKLYKNIFEVANYMEYKYPLYDENIRNFFMEGAITYVFYNEKEISNHPEIKEEAKFIKTLEKRFDVNFFYYYFFDAFKTTKADYNVNRDYTKEEIKDEILSNLSSEFDIIMKSIYELVNNNEILYKLVNYLGFDVMYEYLIRMKRDYYYPFVEILNDHFQIKVEPFLKEGYHMWLVKNYHNYKYYTKEAKNLKKVLAKLNFKLKKHSNNKDIQKDIASKALSAYKVFNDLFERNILSTSKVVHIGTNEFDYTLIIKFNDVYLCKKYYEKNFNTLSNPGLLHLAIEDSKNNIKENVSKTLTEYERVVKKGQSHIGSLRAISHGHKRSFRVYLFNLTLAAILAFLTIYFNDFIFEESSIPYYTIEIPVIYYVVNISYVAIILLIFMFVLVIALFIQRLQVSKFKKALSLYETYKDRQDKMEKGLKEVSQYSYGKLPKSTNLSNSEEKLLKEKEYIDLINLNNKSRPLDKKLKNYKDVLYSNKSEDKYKNYVNYTKKINQNANYKRKKSLGVAFILNIFLLFILNLIIMLVVVQLSRKEGFYLVSDIVGVIETWTFYALTFLPVTYILLHILRRKVSITKQILAIILGTALLLLGLYLIANEEHLIWNLIYNFR